jgi:hypothetical protein
VIETAATNFALAAGATIDVVVELFVEVVEVVDELVDVVSAHEHRDNAIRVISILFILNFL